MGLLPSPAGTMHNARGLKKGAYTIVRLALLKYWPMIFRIIFLFLNYFRSSEVLNDRGFSWDSYSGPRKMILQIYRKRKGKPLAVFQLSRVSKTPTCSWSSRMEKFLSIFMLLSLKRLEIGRLSLPRELCGMLFAVLSSEKNCNLYPIRSSSPSTFSCSFLPSGQI